MNKLKKWLADILYKIANVLINFAAKLSTTKIKVEYKEENLFELGRTVIDERIQKIPTEHPTFGIMSFMEGLSSSDYTIRHSMSASVINWYTGLEKGKVGGDILAKCAEVTLERIGHTINDELELIRIWNKIRDTVNEIDVESVSNEEKALYGRLEKEHELKSLLQGRLSL